MKSNIEFKDPSIRSGANFLLSFSVSLSLPLYLSFFNPTPLSTHTLLLGSPSRKDGGFREREQGAQAIVCRCCGNEEQAASWALLPARVRSKGDVEASWGGQNFPANSDLDFATETRDLEFHGKSPNFRSVPTTEIFF